MLHKRKASYIISMFRLHAFLSFSSIHDVWWHIIFIINLRLKSKHVPNSGFNNCVFFFSRRVTESMTLRHWKKQKLALPWALERLLQNLLPKWYWPMTISRPLWLPLKKGGPSTITWSSSFVTSSLRISEKLWGGSNWHFA